MLVTKPLAIIFHDRLLPGSRVATGLADLGWRVIEAKQPSEIGRLVRAEHPLLVICELNSRFFELGTEIAALQRAPETSHVPFLGYCDPRNQQMTTDALAAGVSMVVGDVGICDQLPQLLDQVLAVE